MNGKPECPAGRKADRIRAVPRPVIADEIVIADFSKNRNGNSARVTLRTYEGTNIVDVRTWHGGVSSAPAFRAIQNKQGVLSRRCVAFPKRGTGHP